MDSHRSVPSPNRRRGEPPRLFSGGLAEPLVMTGLDTDTLDPCPSLQLLTGGQIECLRLVNQHLTSAEIATHLGISRHTVDQRVRTALRVLGVQNRWQAARLVGAVTSREVPSAGLNHRSSALHLDAAAGPLTDWHFPFTTRAHPTNTMRVRTRLFWIVSIAISSMAAAGVYLAGLESLARMLQSWPSA